MESSACMNRLHSTHNITKFSTGCLLQNGRRRNYGTVVKSSMEFVPDNDGPIDATKEKLSKAAKAYLERAQKYDEMMTEAKAEYRVGMRHLANMMGENPDTFTQADANVCVNIGHLRQFTGLIYSFYSICSKLSNTCFHRECMTKRHVRT